MRVKSVLAAGVGLAICGLGASASAQRGDILGEWKTGGCTVTLTDKDWFGDWKASSFACQGDLFSIDRYRIQGDALVLVGMGGPKAKLRLRGDQLVGTDNSGREITLTRKGAPPSLPSRGGGNGGGGWDRDNDRGKDGGWKGGNCVRAGDSERCATQEEQLPPQVQLTATYTLRNQPDAGSNTVFPLRKGTCVALLECRHQGYDLWCKVQAEGAAGWVPQIARRDGQKVLVFKSGCGR
ncbi:MAG: hypothetical protein K0R83_1047 [Caulobacter sp.]|jgi:hypothetical protein|nr:hypothetical protein [Caulobacter sp.]